MARSQTDLADLLARLERVNWLARAACFGFGALMATGLAPFHLPLLSVLALSFALRLLARSPSRRQAALLGWSLGTGYFLVALQWIVEPFLVDIARHGWMAPFAILLMSGGLALFWMAAAGLSWGMGPKDGPRRALALVLALTVAEMARSVLFTGFPWALIGSVWIGHPIGQLAAWGGVHGLTFFTGVLAVGVLTLSIWQASRRALLASGITVLAWGGATVIGETMLARYDATQAPPGPVVRVIQPNEAQHLKWRSDMIPVFWERKLALSSVATAPPPDIIVWPEVSLPWLLESSQLARPLVAEAAQGATTLLGAQRFEGTDLFNSLAVITPDGELGQIHDKHHLVPFGEYFPGGALAERLGLAGLATDMLGGFTAGTGPALIDLGAAGTALPLICYEAIFPRYGNPARLPRPDWIVQVTNDAWFGQFAGPQQHLDQARLRAVEQGLPVVRSANTGISAIIDPMGRILDSLPLGTAGQIQRALPAARPATLYARTGNGPLIFVLFALALWLIRSAVVKGH